MEYSIICVFSHFILEQVSISTSKPLYSLPHLTLSYPISLFVFLPLSLSLHLPLSLHGRVVINPYFIAGEFSSPCRADSSPRSKTLLGPNPILPPCITPSLPPSGPDYCESGIRVAERRGEDVGGRHHNISPQERMIHSVLVCFNRIGKKHNRECYKKREQEVQSAALVLNSRRVKTPKKIWRNSMDTCNFCVELDPIAVLYYLKEIKRKNIYCKFTFCEKANFYASVNRLSYKLEYAFQTARFKV